MRQIGERLEDALSKQSKKYFMLLELELVDLNDPDFGSKFYNICSLPYEINFGGKKYTPDIGVTSFGPPRVSTTVDREIYEVVLIDHANEIQNQVKYGINGKELTVYAGFFDEDNEPILSPADVILAYSGTVDSVVIVNNYESKLAKIQAASPMAHLEATGGFIASKEGMAQIDPTDTSFDQLYSNQKSVTFRWGKR